MLLVNRKKNEASYFHCSLQIVLHIQQRPVLGDQYTKYYTTYNLLQTGELPCATYRMTRKFTQWEIPRNRHCSFLLRFSWCLWCLGVIRVWPWLRWFPWSLPWNIWVCVQIWVPFTSVELSPCQLIGSWDVRTPPVSTCIFTQNYTASDWYIPNSPFTDTSKHFQEASGIAAFFTIVTILSPLMCSGGQAHRFPFIHVDGTTSTSCRAKNSTIAYAI